MPVHRQAVSSATQVCREGWCDGLLVLYLDPSRRGSELPNIAGDAVYFNHRSPCAMHGVPVWTGQVVEEDCRKD